MKTRTFGWLIILSFLLAIAGPPGYAKNAYFGVRNKALGVPAEFGETEAAVEKAERSPGAQYAPDKIARARELGKKAVETYWGCRTEEAMAMLAEARGLARQAELAKAPPKPRPTPVAVAPAKPKPAPAKPTPPPAKKPPVVAAVPKPVAVPPKPKKIIVLQGTYFGFDSAELTVEARAILDEQAAVLEKEADIKVEIAGYTDSTGPKAHNQGLSERRAKAVEEYLISKGISADRLKPVGYGPSQPTASNATREGRAANRRVELNVLEK
jgi:outer membrane protein OmpA-like peptidoglycan-associated protein